MGIGENFAVAYSRPNIVGRIDDSYENANFLNRAGHPAGRNEVAGLKGLKNNQKDAAR
ncbi:MAG TPA: hypothetical protein VMT61_03675 [Candidatus Binataceae bacterium]|nr:hypothetical protein [Candidatus Binataceae bacterium]